MKKRNKIRHDDQAGRETNKWSLQRDFVFPALSGSQRESRIFVESNWRSLDYITRLFGPGTERDSLVGTMGVLRPVLRGIIFRFQVRVMVFLFTKPTAWLCGLQSRHWITGKSKAA